MPGDKVERSCPDQSCSFVGNEAAPLAQMVSAVRWMSRNWKGCACALILLDHRQRFL